MKKIKTVVSRKDLDAWNQCKSDVEFQKFSAAMRKKYKLPSEYKYAISCYDGAVYVGDEKLKITNV